MLKGQVQSLRFLRWVHIEGGKFLLSSNRSKEHCFILFVDAENCSSHNFMKVCRKLRELEKTHQNAGMYCYGLKAEEDGRLKSWREVTSYSFCIWQWLEGKPQKNKVDKRIIGDVELLLSQSRFDKIDTYCFMTSDGDYVGIIKKLRDKKKFTIVFGKSNASKELKSSCNLFKPWDE